MNRKDQKIKLQAIFSKSSVTTAVKLSSFVTANFYIYAVISSCASRSECQTNVGGVLVAVTIQTEACQKLSCM